MPKYGKGLGKEIYLAAKKGIILQPFTVSDCRKFVLSKGWDVPESYLKVVLANSERERNHSDNYTDYFSRVSKGKYIINSALIV